MNQEGLNYVLVKNLIEWTVGPDLGPVIIKLKNKNLVGALK